MGQIDRLEQIAQQAERLAGTTPSVSRKADNTTEGKLTRIYEALTVLNAGLFTNDFDYIDFTNDLSPLPDRQVGRVYFNSTTQSLEMPVSDDVTQQIGQELLLRVHNDTGATIPNGAAVEIEGYDGHYNVKLATKEVGIGTFALATEDIEADTMGMVCVVGVVNGIDTSAFAAGDTLYLNGGAGQYATTSPASPNYAVKIGTVVRVGTTDGAVYVKVEEQGNTQGLDQFYDGTSLESYTTNVESDGSAITLTITPDSGTSLTLVLSGVLQSFTAPASVTLTAGTDSVPTLNYVYIPESTLTLTASTDSFPSEDHQPVATVFCQSAASMQNDVPYKNHSWVDHLGRTPGNGHLSDLNFWIRQQHATWLTGCELSTTDGATAYLSTTSGTVLQLHVNSVPAFDMTSGDDAHVVNDPTTPYLSTTDMVADITTDSTGASLNNKYFKLVFFLIANSDGMSPTMLINLPGGFYLSADSAEADADAHANFSLPNDFRGTGIILGTCVYRLAGGSWTSYGVVDLRGSLIAATGGGAGSSATSEFSDANFRTYNSADPTKELAFDVSGVTTATTRTLTIPDGSGVIALVDLAQTLTNKTIAAGSNTISGLTHGSEVDNPTSGVHGVTGTVVGTTDSQTLTNKTIDPSANTIDGDVLDITYTPTNYTPDASAPEASDVDDLAAHLKGVDTAIGAAGGGGGGIDLQTFTSSGTWTKPAGAVAVRIICIGGGAGGGSGGLISDSGGGGGQGGNLSEAWCDADDLGATETVTIGAGGAGAAAKATTSGSGSKGTNGGNTLFGTTTILKANGGEGGDGGTTVQGPGGDFLVGSGKLTQWNQHVGAAQVMGGTGGLGEDSNNATTTGMGYKSRAGGGGGGGGGGNSSSGGNAGGAGGDNFQAFSKSTTDTYGARQGGGGAGGAAQSLNDKSGQNGTAGAASLMLDRGGKGGGAGSGTGGNDSLGGYNAGNGGAGGAPGGGGGGGGAAAGLILASTSQSGSGGAGADGKVVVITYL